MKYAEVKRMLSKGRRAYFVEHGDRHDVWYSAITRQPFIIPRHDGKEVPTGTLHRLEVQSGVSLKAKPRRPKPRS